MNIRTQTTRADRILIFLMLVCSIAALVTIFWMRSTASSAAVDVSIQVDGKEVDHYSLASMEGKTIPYETEFGKNLVRIEQGEVFIIEADCPDKLCIQEGKISKPGQVLICLPNRFMVELMSADDSEPDVDVYLR